LPKVIIGKDGSFKIPEDYLGRRRLPNCREWWLDQRGNAVVLLPRLPDLQKLYVEPTSNCNLNCRTCIRHAWDEGNNFMDMDTFRHLIEKTEEFPDLKRVVLGGLGEPLTHPELFDMICLARDRGLAVTLGTNGHLLDNAVSQELVSLGVDSLVVSLDGIKPKTYAGVRGTSISQVLENIHILNETKKKLGSLLPSLGIEFVALQSNIAELAGLGELASTLGAARVLVSNVLAYTEEMRDEVLYGYEPQSPSNSGSWPVRMGAWVMWGTLNLPRMHWGSEQRCRFVHDREAFVCWDGSIAPCYALSHTYSYFTIDGRKKDVTRYTMGSIETQSLLEIWTSENYCRFRSEVGEFNFPSCPDCDLRETCDLREQNEGCWGWNPSCADCLWAQDIIRCP
jgi:tungsten cofactor oxidoreducase radical SAM maturase